MWSNPYNVKNLPVSLGKGASEYLGLKPFSDYTVVEQKMDTEQNTTEQPKSYSLQYYHNHKEKIHQYRKESGLSERSYKKYYQANKEIIKQKNLARYHRKKQEEQTQLEMQQRQKNEEP